MGWLSKPKSDPLIGQAAKQTSQLSTDQFNWYRNLFDTQIMPRQAQIDQMNLNVGNQLLADSKAASDFAAQQRDEYKNTYLPVERQSAADAMGYDSQANVDRQTGIAGANVRQAFDSARQRMVDELAKYGVRPDPNAFLATQRRLATAGAAAEAGARTGAAISTQDKAIGLRAGVASLGRGLPNTVAGLMGSANQSGSSAVGNSVSGAGVGINGISATGQGAQGAIGGITAAGNLALNNWQARASTNPGLELLGTGLGVFAGIKSSKKYKDRNESLDGDNVLDKVKGLKVDRWGYKGDTQLHVGPYAEDLHAKFGVGNGEEIGPTDVGGIALAAVKQLNDKVDALGQKLGLQLGGKA